MKKYKIKYNIEPNANITKEEAVAAQAGATDQILLCSYLEGENNGGSYLWVSNNGNGPNQPMSPARKLHCLAVLARELSQDTELSFGGRHFCAQIFEAFKASKLREKQKGKDTNG